jgi:hypothetical protein
MGFILKATTHELVSHEGRGDNRYAHPGIAAAYSSLRFSCAKLLRVVDLHLVERHDAIELLGNSRKGLMIDFAFAAHPSAEKCVGNLSVSVRSRTDNKRKLHA